MVFSLYIILLIEYKSIYDNFNSIKAYKFKAYIKEVQIEITSKSVRTLNR